MSQPQFAPFNMYIYGVNFVLFAVSNSTAVAAKLYLNIDPESSVDVAHNSYSTMLPRGNVNVGVAVGDFVGDNDGNFVGDDDGDGVVSIGHKLSLTPVVKFVINASKVGQ